MFSHCLQNWIYLPTPSISHLETSTHSVKKGAQWPEIFIFHQVAWQHINVIKTSERSHKYPTSKLSSHSPFSQHVNLISSVGARAWEPVSRGGRWELSLSSPLGRNGGSKGEGGEQLSLHDWNETPKVKKEAAAAATAKRPVDTTEIKKTTPFKNNTSRKNERGEIRNHGVLHVTVNILVI